MEILTRAKKVCVIFFWPWVKTIILPIIIEKIKELIDLVLDSFKEKIINVIFQQKKEKEYRANQKAEDYERKANNSRNKEEAEKFRGVAQVWREVAEQFRQENETLKIKIDALSEKVKEKALKDVDSLEIDLDFSDEKPKLSIGRSTYNLPPLSSGDNKE